MTTQSNKIALKVKKHTFTQFQDSYMVYNEFGAIYGRNLRIHIRYEVTKKYYCPTKFSTRAEAERFISTVENGHLTVDDMYSEEEIGQYV